MLFSRSRFCSHVHIIWGQLLIHRRHRHNRINPIRYVKDPTITLTLTLTQTQVWLNDRYKSQRSVLRDCGRHNALLEPIKLYSLALICNSFPISFITYGFHLQKSDEASGESKLVLLHKCTRGFCKRKKTILSTSQLTHIYY